MNRRSLSGVAALMLAVTVGLGGESAALPVVRDVPLGALREQSGKLQEALARLQAPLPLQTRRELEEALRRGATAPTDAAEKIQRLLDPFCVVAVTINPESRVKAARGPAAAALALDRKTFFLIKVVNEGGVTHALEISGPQLTSERPASSGRWLEAKVEFYPAREKKLTGQKLEYVIVGLKARQKGKREATLKFDVGQGTQDLGFRAEVPVLFTIR